MIDMILRFGIGLKPSSYHEIRETCLKKEVDFTQQMLEEYKVEWKKKKKAVPLCLIAGLIRKGDPFVIFW